jgi:hypothetical protein
MSLHVKEAPNVPTRWLALALVSLTLAVVALTLPYKLSNGDTWVHLKTGEYVLRQGWVPIKDPYSFTAAEHEFIAHEWLASVLFALVYAAGGATGLIVFKFVLASVTYAITYKTARLLGARLSVILPSFACLLYIVTYRVVERPHLFSSLLLALYLYLFFRYRDGGRDPRWLYVIPPVHVVWANLHGGHLQGLALVACWTLGEACLWARARYLGIGAEKALPRPDVLRLAGLVPACAAAACLTPYGPRLLWFPVEMTLFGLFFKPIQEWWPPYRMHYFTPWFYGYVVHVVTLWATFFAVHRDRSRSLEGANRVMRVTLWLVCLGVAYSCLHPPGTPWVPAVLATLLYALLGLFVVFTVVNLRTVDFTQAAIVVPCFLLGLQHQRYIPDAALTTYPILAALASAVLEARHRAAARPVRLRPRDGSSPAAIIGGACLLLSLATHASIFTYYWNFHGDGFEKGFGASTNTRLLPTCAVDFAIGHQLQGHAFVSFNFSPLVIYRMHPAVHVNIDIRDYVYGEPLFLEYARALSSPAAMRDYLTRYRVDFFLLPLGNHPVADALQATGAWIPVHYDDHAFVMVRRTPDTEVLIRREGYRFIRPWENAPMTTANASQVLEEANRALRNCPNAASWAYAYQAEALLRLGRDEEARAAARQIPKVLRLDD